MRTWAAKDESMLQQFMAGQPDSSAESAKSLIMKQKAREYNQKNNEEANKGDAVRSPTKPYGAL